MSWFDPLIKPKALPFDYDEWAKKPFGERAKMLCQAWAKQGFGAPPSAMLFYVFKIGFYIALWFFFCSFSNDLGSWSELSDWFFKIEALGKAIFWTMLMEVIGWGGGSGPLTGRYLPPFGASTYYLRCGTIKLPLLPGLPFIGSDRRSILDVGLYAVLLLLLLRICTAPEITASIVLPVVLLLPMLGVLDRQIYLAARADVWFPAACCFLFPEQTPNALIICWFAVWFWAAFSKLTPSFSSVIAVMICNSPFLNWNFLKNRIFRDYPNDLRLSRSADYIAHFSTAVEFILPILLLLSVILQWNPSIVFSLLIGMALFHLFIFINFPAGVPMEWNVIMVYGGIVLFGFQNMHSPLLLNEPLLIALFSICFFALPLIGHFFPKQVSFLMSMRYYAGTWAYSVWLFKKGVKMEKLEPNIVKSSSDLRQQLAHFYDEQTYMGALSRITAFRLMHLPGRALPQLLPKAVDEIDDYYWMDGEFIAGEVGGWNFGDAHFSSETMLNSIQKRCSFEEGELRVIMVESPRLHNGKMHWRIHDAELGLVEEGEISVYDLKEVHPWSLEL